MADSYAPRNNNRCPWMSTGTDHSSRVTLVWIALKNQDFGQLFSMLFSVSSVD